MNQSEHAKCIIRGSEFNNAKYYMTAEYFLLTRAGIHICQGGLGAHPDQVQVNNSSCFILKGVSEFLPMARDAFSSNQKTYLSLEV